MSEENKKRSSNFTQREKDILISLVEKHINILECKKTNAVYNKQKHECWEKLAWEYNALQTSGQRTGFQLRTLYEQMKKLAKQHKADNKVEILKTGGGDNTKHKILSSQDEKILSLLQEKYFCVDNVLDSNCLMQNNSETENSLYPTPSTSSTTRNFQSGDEARRSSLSLKTNIGHLTDNINDNDDAEETIEIVLEGEPNEDEEESQSLLQFQTRKKHRLNQEGDNVEADNVHKKRNRNEKSNNKQLDKSSSLSAKKFEVYENKIQVLHLVQRNEEEALKGKKLENEIKQIIKEKELLDLKIKKKQYDILLEKNDF